MVNAPVAVLEDITQSPPEYGDVLDVDSNPDVITTSVEITSDDGDGEPDDVLTRHPGPVRSVDQTPRPSYPSDRKKLRPRRSSVSKDAIRSPRNLIGDLIKKTAIHLSVRPTSPDVHGTDGSTYGQAMSAQFVATRRPSLPSSGFPEELPASVKLGRDVDEHEYACRIEAVNELLERGEVRAARKLVRRAFDGKVELVRFDSPAMQGAQRAHTITDNDGECASDDECASNVSSQSRRIERGHKQSTITYVHDDDEASTDDDSQAGHDFDHVSLASSLTRSLRKWNPARRFSAISQTCSIQAPPSTQGDDEIEFAGFVPHEAPPAAATSQLSTAPGPDRNRLPHEAWCLLFT